MEGWIEDFGNSSEFHGFLHTRHETDPKAGCPVFGEIHYRIEDTDVENIWSGRDQRAGDFGTNVVLLFVFLQLAEELLGILLIIILGQNGIDVEEFDVLDALTGPSHHSTEEWSSVHQHSLFNSVFIIFAYIPHSGAHRAQGTHWLGHHLQVEKVSFARYILNLPVEILVPPLQCIYLFFELFGFHKGIIFVPTASTKVLVCRDVNGARAAFAEIQFCPFRRIILTFHFPLLAARAWPLPVTFPVGCIA